MPNAASSAPTPPALFAQLRWLLGITRPVHLPLLFSLCCRVIELILDIALFGIATAGVVAWLTEGPLGRWFFPTLIGIALGKAIFIYLEQFSGHFVAFKALELLRGHVFAHMWPKAPAIVAHTKSGELLASITRDVDRIEVVYAHTFAPVVSAWIVGTATIACAIGWFGWSMTSVAVLCLVFSLVVVPILGFRTAVRQTQRVLDARRALAHHVTDSVMGRQEVVGYHMEAQRLADMDHHGDTIATLSKTPRDWTGIRRGLNIVSMLLAMLSLCVLAKNSLSMAVLGGLVAATFRAFEGPRGIEDATGYLDHSFAAIRRLWILCHMPERVHDGPNTLDCSRAPALAFHKVNYHYPLADTAHVPYALSDVTFDIPAGRRTVIVGRSGSGKSTIAQLLVRFDDPQGGWIDLEGIPLREYTLDSLRRHVVLMAQSHQLLSTTIAENLRLGVPNASDDALWNVLEIVGIADEIRAMPDRLDTHCGKNGGALSGGQAQRVCLARALLMRPNVLILDEFTANLNVALEQQIRQALAQWPHPMTVIEITHRLEAIQPTDHVIVMDQGRVWHQGLGDRLHAASIETFIRQDRQRADDVAAE